MNTTVLIFYSKTERKEYFFRHIFEKSNDHKMATIKNSNLIKLPASELTIMNCIWNLDEQGVKDIHAGMLRETYPDDAGSFALTTVITLMGRLHAKGFIDLEKHGRTNCAIIKVDRAKYQKAITGDFISTVYNNNKKGLISALYNGGIITKEDIDELRREIAQDK